VRRKCIFEYNQQDATLYNVFISAKCATCFRPVLHPSSGAQNCIHNIGYLPELTAICRCLGRVGTVLRVQQQSCIFLVILENTSETLFLEVLAPQFGGLTSYPGGLGYDFGP
jgi:hypothetical protein